MPKHTWKHWRNKDGASTVAQPAAFMRTCLSAHGDSVLMRCGHAPDAQAKLNAESEAADTARREVTEARQQLRDLQIEVERLRNEVEVRTVCHNSKQRLLSTSSKPFRHCCLQLYRKPGPAPSMHAVIVRLLAFMPVPAGPYGPLHSAGDSAPRGREEVAAQLWSRHAAYRGAAEPGGVGWGKRGSRRRARAAVREAEMQLGCTRM